MTNVSSELFSKLRNGLIDLIILNLSSQNYGNDIEITKCSQFQDCFVVNESLKHLTNKVLSFQDLNNYPLILQAKGSNARNFLDDLSSLYNVRLKPSIELTSYSLVEEFAKIGLGIGYVNEKYIQDDLKKHQLYKLNIKEEIPPRYIGIATCISHVPNFSTKKLISIIKHKS